MKTTDLEIAIVGGGPAGLSAWLHVQALAPELARRSAVFEKAVHPREKLCGGGMTPLGNLLLRGLRLELDCPAITVEEIQFRAGDATLPFRYPAALRVVSRALFDEALAKAATQRGLDLRQDEAVADVEWAGDHARLRTAKGEYTARVVVGADGVNSVVRQRMNLGDESRVARLIEVVGLVDPERDSEFSARVAVFDFSPTVSGLQGYVWHFPCLDRGLPAVNRGIYDSCVHPERARPDLPLLFAAALRQGGLEMPEATWKSHPVRWFSADAQTARPHGFLVGDAAGVDALLGEGIAPSLDYGDFAANVLIDAFSRGDFSFAQQGERLLAHPLGRSLEERGQLARRIYAEGGVEPGQLPAVMLRLLGQG